MLGLFVHREFGDEVEDERGVGGGGGAEVGGQGGGVRWCVGGLAICSAAGCMSSFFGWTVA